MNRIIIRNANLSSAINEFFEEFVDCIIVSLVNLFFEYDQLSLIEKCRDMTIFMISLDLMKMTTIFMKAINFVTQFVRMINKIIVDHVFHHALSFVNDIKVKKIKNDVSQWVHSFWNSSLCDETYSVIKWRFDKHWKIWLHYFREKISILLRRTANDRFRLRRWKTTFKYNEDHQDSELIFLSKRCRRSWIYRNLRVLSNFHCEFCSHCSVDLCFSEKECILRMKLDSAESNEYFQDCFYQFFRFYLHRLCD
jgi:hypothetical protein